MICLWGKNIISNTTKKEIKRKMLTWAAWLVVLLWAPLPSACKYNPYPWEEKSAACTHMLAVKSRSVRVESTRAPHNDSMGRCTKQKFKNSTCSKEYRSKKSSSSRISNKNIFVVGLSRQIQLLVGTNGRCQQI